MHNIDTKTLKAWLDEKEAIIIDVRSAKEYEESSIPGARLMPMLELTKAKLPCGEGKKLVFYCRSGKRSAEVCSKLLGEDSSLELYNLEGGILAWSSELSESSSFKPF
jgi:rhodanese-related sulfurtransferase